MTVSVGPLALVGGDEFTEGCDFDAGLAASVGAEEVVVVPAAAAFLDRPRRLDRARAWFESLGVGLTILDVWARADALDDRSAGRLAEARMIYVMDGASMHLRSVLSSTPTLEAMVDAWRRGGVLAASGAGADVLCDAMVDARGGAFTVGLGVLSEISVIPHYDRWSREKVRRTVGLASDDMVIAGIPDRTALIADGGTWRTEGVGDVDVYRAGELVGVAALPAIA